MLAASDCQLARMAEALARLKKKRGANRGSVTRITTHVGEELEAEGGPDYAKLQQYKASLTEKLKILAALDDEILDLVEEDELDNEVEQADILRERIGLCIIGIDQARPHLGGAQLNRPLNVPTETPAGALLNDTPPTDENPTDELRLTRRRSMRLLRIRSRLITPPQGQQS